MEFIQVAYCVTVPILLALILFTKDNVRGYSRNLLAVSNLLLIGHSIFLIRQLLGFYYLVIQYAELPASSAPMNADGYRLLALMVLPFFSLLGPVRRNLLFSLVMLVLLYWHHPYFTWNTFDLWRKVPYYISLQCTVYALFWLIRKLPFQSKQREA